MKFNSDSGTHQQEPILSQEAPPVSESPHLTAEEWQELHQILWTMGEVLGEQTVILEELSLRLPTLPHEAQVEETNRETDAVRHTLEKTNRELSAIRTLLEQGREQVRKRDRHPSLLWFVFPLCAALFVILHYIFG